MGNNTPTLNCTRTSASQITIPSTNEKNAVNTFEIYIQNLKSCDKYGNCEYTFKDTDFKLPSTIVTGLNTLADLIKKVGEGNISIDYYASASGSVSSHDCYAVQSLYCHGKFADGSCTNQTVLAQTSSSPNSGGPVNSGWKLLIKNIPLMLSSINTNSVCNGSGCGCVFSSYGGWSNTNIGIKAEVTINLISYCSQMGVDNLNTPLCFNYVSNYISKNGPNEQFTTALKNYCSRKFTGKGLDILNPGYNIDPNDSKLCACNMPDSDYNQFLQSVIKKYPDLNLGSIRPNCLVPACVTSPFKGTDLDGCPIPQCLNVVTFNGNDIQGNIAIDQKQECNNIVSGKGPNTPPPPNKTTSTSFFNKYKWWILLLVILLIIIIIVIVLMNKKENVSQTTTD